MLLLAQMGPSSNQTPLLPDKSPTHARCKDPGHCTMITVDNVKEYAQKAAYGSMLSLMPHKSSDMMLDISDPQGRAKLSSKYTCDGRPL